MSHAPDLSEITELAQPFDGPLYGGVADLFVNELYRAISRQDWRKGQIREPERLLADCCPALGSDAMRIFCVTAEESQVVAGAIAYHAKTPTLDKVRGRVTSEIKLLAIEPKYRRRGIASQLIRHVEEIAQEDGVERLILRRVLDGAIPLYRRLGYVKHASPFTFGADRERQYSKPLK